MISEMIHRVPVVQALDGFAVGIGQDPGIQDRTGFCFGCQSFHLELPSPKCDLRTPAACFCIFVSESSDAETSLLLLLVLLFSWAQQSGPVQ